MYQLKAYLFNGTVNPVGLALIYSVIRVITM